MARRGPAGALTGPSSTLLLLVTCSRDESRRDAAIAVARNLAQLAPRAGLSESFVAFDNASTFPDHLDFLPPGTVVCRSAENLGYWSAIKWVLDNRRQLGGKPHDYLYIVESELYHRDLAPLGECERFLAAEPRASGVRTQEFSVRARWRYDKRLRFLPFHVERSHVSLANAVTGEKAWFKAAVGFEGLYLSNLHPKLPALNRISALEAVFENLARRDVFTEQDFFAEMMRLHPLIGVLDGGLFHALFRDWSDRARAVSGSHTPAAELTRLGYLPTRTARIVPFGPDIVVRSRA